MAFGGGIALKSVSFFLRIIELCCSAIILGIFSYFLATLHNHKLSIATYLRAVEGISGAAVVYTLVGLLLVCFVGGITFFSSIGMLLDFAFCGAFIYIIYATRGGVHSCNGNVNTPFGSGNGRTGTVNQGSSGFTELPSLHTACELEKVCFAVAIIGAVFFLLSILMELGLIKHHKKEKHLGPSPNNGYTAGAPKRKFWQRKPKNTNHDLEKNPNALPAHSTPADVRDSYATESTAVNGHNNHHLGRDAAVVGGAGALGTHEYRKHEGSHLAGATGQQHDNTSSAVPPQLQAGQQSGVTGTQGYGHQTTTTTHVPHEQ